MKGTNDKKREFNTEVENKNHSIDSIRRKLYRNILHNLSH